MSMSHSALKNKQHCGVQSPIIKIQSYSLESGRLHLVALANWAVIETENADEVLQELTDADSRDVRGAAQGLGRQKHTQRHTHRERHTKQMCPSLSGQDWCELKPENDLDGSQRPVSQSALTQNRSSSVRMANLQRRSVSVRTGEEERSDTQRTTPANWPHSRSCLSTGVWHKHTPQHSERAVPTTASEHKGCVEHLTKTNETLST